MQARSDSKTNRTNSWRELERGGKRCGMGPLVPNKLFYDDIPWGCKNIKLGGNLPGHLKTDPLQMTENEAKRKEGRLHFQSLLQCGSQVFFRDQVITLSSQGGIIGWVVDLW